jgi:hypothetical protein
MMIVEQSVEWELVNPTQLDLHSNPGCRGGKPVANRLSYSMTILSPYHFYKIMQSQGKSILKKRIFITQWMKVNGAVEVDSWCRVKSCVSSVESCCKRCEQQTFSPVACPVPMFLMINLCFDVAVVDKVALEQVFPRVLLIFPSNHHSAVAPSVRCVIALTRQHVIVSTVLKFQALCLTWHLAG